MAGAYLYNSIQRDFTPVVMVLSTEKAEGMCQRNGLSFVDLMRPFSNLQQINVPVRTASEQPYRIQDFQLRIFHASEIRQPSAEAAEEHLTQIVSASSEAAAAELKGDPKDLNAVLTMANSDNPVHWYRQYFHEFGRALAFSEHESIDHPVACLLVVPSSAEDPINTFVDLYNTEQLPPLYNDQLMDPKIVKHFVLLHDAQTGDLARAETILASMRGTFGADACRILQINSGRWPGTPPLPDIWSAHKLPPIETLQKQPPLDKTGAQKEQELGGELSDQDLEGIREFMAELAVKQIIPQMEQKIRALNHTVSATRKGLKNQLKNFWFSGTKRSDGPEVGRTEDGQYPFTTTEAQIRLLGDLAFMLRDYELALSNYRLLTGDYRGDKAWKHLAGTLEMTGLCMFMLNQAPREAESSLEGAYQAYIRSGAGGVRYATRAAYWLGEIYKARGMFREAAAVLTRTAQEEQNLRAALLLEQSAICYLRTAPPLWRKFGFHMVLAGHRYNQGLQRAHAQRTYQTVLGVYEGRGWAYISDHVNFALGRISAHLGDYHAAVAFFSRLLASSHQSPAAQSTFLREFLYVVQAVDLGVPLSLDLPTVHIDNFRVHFEDHRTYSAQAAAMVSERVWTSLEEGLVPTTNVVMQTWMDRPAKGSHKDIPVPTNTCVEDEEITVDVEFSNPLQLSLDISCARLVCEWSPDDGPKTSPIPRTSSVPTMDDRASDSGGSSPADSLPTPLARHHGLDPRVSSTGCLSDRNDPLLTSSDSLPSPRHANDLQTRDDARGGSRTAPTSPRGGGGNGFEESVEPPGEAYRVVEEAFSLPGGGRTVVRLRVKPLMGGMLRIVGVEWVLNNIAQGRKDFPVKLPRKKRKGGRPDKEYPPHTRLGFKVIGKMPKLQVTMHQLPEQLHHGELRRLVLELSNSGGVPLKKLKLRTSHPAFFCMGLQGDLEGEFPACLEVGGVRPTPGPDAGTSKTNYTFVFPQSTVLEGGSTLLWPLWLHARDVGTFQFHTLLYYEPDPPDSSMKYRTARITSSIHVAPSLAVGARLAVSPAQLDRQLLWLEVENKHPQDTFTLRQVSCAGALWRLSPLSSQGGLRPASLAPSQATSLPFHIEANAAKGGPVENEQFSSTVRLDTGNTGGAIDVSSGPLLRFHARERWLQGDGAGGGAAKSQPRGSTADAPGPVPESSPLDVVLIWEQQERRKSISAVEDPARIGSFHICHQTLKGLSPVRWLLTGPPSPVLASFTASPLLEVPLSLYVRNCAPALATVRIETLDSAGAPSESSPPGGWYCPPILPSPSSSGDVVSTLGGSPAPGADPPGEDQPCGTSPCPPYLWSGSTYRVVEDLRPGEESAVPLSVAVFAPGVYDVCKYRVSWTLKPLPASEEATPGADVARPPGLPPRPKSATPPAKAQQRNSSGGQGKGAGGRQGSGAEGLGGFEREGSGMGQPWLLVVKEGSHPPAESTQTSVSSPGNLLDV